MRYFREYLAEVFLQFPEYIRDDIPQDFTLNHLTGSFTEAVKWWMKGGMKSDPEKIISYYLNVIQELVFWEKEEEFSAQVRVFVRENATDYVHYETISFMIADLFQKIDRGE